METRRQDRDVLSHQFRGQQTQGCEREIGKERLRERKKETGFGARERK